MPVRRYLCPEPFCNRCLELVPVPSAERLTQSRVASTVVNVTEGGEVTVELQLR